MDCQLPVTGSSPFASAVLAFIVLGVGVALMLIVRRRGFGGGTAVVLALLLGTTAFAVTDSRSADAAACPPATTTTVAATTTTTPATTTTTAATTTTTSTTTTTTTTTTTIPQVPDLVPTIVGAATLAQPGSQPYVVTLTNSGNGPTTAALDFTFELTILTGTGVLTASPDLNASPDFDFLGSTSTGGGGVSLGFASKTGVVLAPGASTTVTVGLQWGGGAIGGSVLLQTTLPTGIGGETNDANNTASLVVTVLPID